MWAEGEAEEQVVIVVKGSDEAREREKERRGFPIRSIP